MSSNDPMVCGFGPDDIRPFAVMQTWARILDENNVPRRNRWIIVPPWFAEYVREEARFVPPWFAEYVREEARYFMAVGQIIAGPPRDIAETGSVLGFSLLLGDYTPLSLEFDEGYAFRILLIAGIYIDPRIENKVLQSGVDVYQTTLLKGEARGE